MHSKFSLGGGDPERQTVRRFTDAKGLEWVVYAVVKPALAPEGGIPSTFLCFERGVDRRRLAPIPEAWSALPDERLALLVRAAVPVVRRVGADA